MLYHFDSSKQSGTKGRANAATVTGDRVCVDQFTRGWTIPDHGSTAEALVTLSKLGWLPEHPAYELVFFYPPLQSLRGVSPGRIKAHDLCQLSRLALYFHVPYCTGICTYCHYARQTLPGSAVIRRHIDLLEREYQILSRLVATGPNKPKLSSVHVGGGTPFSLPPACLLRLERILAQSFACWGDAAVTWEASPETISNEKMNIVTADRRVRLSIGVESLDDPTLRFVNRRHTVREALEAVALAMAHPNISSVNVDLIYGFPHVSPDSWTKGLERLLNLRPQSISLYRLRPHPSTPLGRLILRNPEIAPTPHDLLRMQIEAMQVLIGAGYAMDPVNRFTLGQDSVNKYQYDTWRDNLSYWGFGLGTYWYVCGITGCNHADLNSYSEAVLTGTLPIAVARRLSEVEIITKKFVPGLKFAKGVSLDGNSLPSSAEYLQQALRELQEHGFLQGDGASAHPFRFTSLALPFSDILLMHLYTPHDKECLRKRGLQFGAYGGRPGY